MMQITKHTSFYGFILMGMIINISCEDLIEVDQPRTQLITPSVFKDDLTAIAAVSDLYNSLTNEHGGFQAITYLTSLSADELQVENGPTNTQEIYGNNILSTNSDIATLWQARYHQVYLANACIEGLKSSTTITPSLKDQLLGEAFFFRAFHHFYLMNIFGKVPYVTTTDYRVTSFVPREEIDAVYDKITADLQETKTLLANDYSFSNGERVRVNKWVATALLARVYLYRRDWEHAEEQATIIINNTTLFGLTPDMNAVFLKNSIETIWQLIPGGGQKYVGEGGIFANGYGLGEATLTEDFYNAFEPGDQRKDKWILNGEYLGIPWHNPYKYKEKSPGTGVEYHTVFRLAEQILIRAEARAHQPGKIIGVNSALSDINMIRTRAGLPALSVAEVSNVAEALAAIGQQRRFELFVEWGHRWFDLKRTEQANAVLSIVKLGWNETDVLYPIPYSELQLNPNMEQNDGY